MSVSIVTMLVGGCLGVVYFALLLRFGSENRATRVFCYLVSADAFAVLAIWAWEVLT